jgi:diguanylate cyclase (GGDEF)-like protein
MGVALENANRLEEIRALADQDGVTGLLNHRAIHEHLRVELLRAQRFGHSLAVLMIDLNGFKLFNDTYGHPAGDRVIRQVAHLLRDNVRSVDLVGRYGGDEFIVVLPETTAASASMVAAKLRKIVAKDGFQTEDGKVVPIGASFGVACFPDDASQIEQLVAQADANLYESKHRGGEPVTNQNPNLASSNDPALRTIGELLTNVDDRNPQIRQQSEQITAYALAIADAVGLPDQTRQTLRLIGQVRRENLPLLGHIISVAEVYVDLTSDRPYRQAMSNSEAHAELRRLAGTQLDPDLVETFLGILEAQQHQSSLAS